MASRPLSRKRKTLWSQSGPTPRMAFGAAMIVLVGVLGMTPKAIFGLSVAWPFAALWGAIGWGRVGLSLRPMFLLVLFGLAQDIISNAPLGCFVIVNLGVYALSAAIAEHTEGMRDPFVAIVAPVVLLLAAFLLVWLFASLAGNQAVRAAPLLAAFFVTGVSYAIAQQMYDLGRRPGDGPGQQT